MSNQSERQHDGQGLPPRAGQHEPQAHRKAGTSRQIGPDVGKMEWRCPILNEVPERYCFQGKTGQDDIRNMPTGEKLLDHAAMPAEIYSVLATPNRCPTSLKKTRTCAIGLLRTSSLFM